MTTMASRRGTLVAVCLVVAIAMTACGAAKEEARLSVPAGAKAGELLDLRDCVYKGAGVSARAQCGTLVVPENRADPDSRLIAIPLIRVPALNGGNQTPIFFLQGGPGGTNQEFQYLAGLADDRDFIQVGYRGVDGSEYLDCPEISEAVRKAPNDMLNKPSRDSYRQAAADCARRWQAAGVDLAGYTITETIEDMEDARRALGYDRIDLLGESYGARVEYVYELMHPESLERVIIIAVNPPGHFTWKAADVDKQLEDYAALCARDDRCRARTSDLVASMRRVSENMPRSWLFFPIDPGGVKLVTFVMFMESIQPAGAPVPLNGPAAVDMWLAAERGDASGFALITMARNAFIPELFVFGEFLAKGGSGDDFHDPARDFEAELNPPGAILGSPLSYWHAAMSEGWPATLIPEEYRQLRPTDVETLLISGSIDFSTPPQFATDELLPQLKHGRQVILKDFGHTESFWQSQPQARVQLINTFYDTGEVDASLYTYQPVNFDAGLGWPGMAKIALGIALAVLLLLVALAWWVVGRVRRRRKA